MEQGEGCGEKFTPGPWRVISNSPTDIYVRDDGGLIARGATPTFYPDQHDRYVAELAEYAANARLIASAPELYEALQRCVAHMTDHPMFNDPDAGECETLRIARAALLKASGGKDV